MSKLINYREAIGLLAISGFTVSAEKQANGTCIIANGEPVNVRLYRDGSTWKVSEDDIVDWIDNRKDDAYTKYENIYIDIPPTSPDSEASWSNVQTLKDATKGEAVQWIRENIGACDDDGNVCLLTFGEPASNQ